MALETAFSCPNRILASLSQLKTLYADEKVPSQEKYGNYAPQAKCHGVSDCRDAVGWNGGSACMAVHRSHDRRLWRHPGAEFPGRHQGVLVHGSVRHAPLVRWAVDAGRTRHPVQSLLRAPPRVLQSG